VKKKVKWIIAVTVLVLLLATAVTVLGQALVPKAGAWALMQDFYALPKNTLDVLFFGRA